MDTKDIDWEYVESKISAICYRFENLSAWKEDLAQELRIHAYYVSDNYYDLYRKAIDFWRKIQTRQAPEIPYFDLEVLNLSTRDDTEDQFQRIIYLVREELKKPGKNKWENDRLELAGKLLDIIVSDIEETEDNLIISSKSSKNPYINQRLNLSLISEETGISYKRLVDSMKVLEDIIQGLAVMKKIDIPLVYLVDYYDK